MSEEPKTYHMAEITLSLAQEMINNEEAGFYSYRCQSPIVHPEAMCVFADGRWWHITDGEFQIEDKGIVMVSGYPNAWTRAHDGIVMVDDDHPIVRLLRMDAEQDNGPDTPVPVSKILENWPGKQG